MPTTFSQNRSARRLTQQFKYTSLSSSSRSNNFGFLVAELACILITQTKVSISLSGPYPHNSQEMSSSQISEPARLNHSYPYIDPGQFKASLTGSNVLVTGAGRGIGRAIALAFSDAGANIACVARTLSELLLSITSSHYFKFPSFCVAQPYLISIYGLYLKE